MRKLLVYPPFYFLCAIVLNFVLFFLFPNSKRTRFPFNLLGAIVGISGFYIMSGCTRVFNKKRTTFELALPSAFVRDGFYKVSRNPMYLGALMLILGQSILLGPLIALGVPVLFFLFINFLCIPPEERIMESTFGDRYLQYKQKVRRWI